jgi:hypothetical protein
MNLEGSVALVTGSALDAVETGAADLAVAS